MLVDISYGCWGGRNASRLDHAFLFSSSPFAVFFLLQFCCSLQSWKIYKALLPTASEDSVVVELPLMCLVIYNASFFCLVPFASYELRIIEQRLSVDQSKLRREETEFRKQQSANENMQCITLVKQLFILQQLLPCFPSLFLQRITKSACLGDFFFHFQYSNKFVLLGHKKRQAWVKLLQRRTFLLSQASLNSLMKVASYVFNINLVALKEIRKVHIASTLNPFFKGQTQSTHKSQWLHYSSSSVLLMGMAESAIGFPNFYSLSLFYSMQSGS